MKSGLLPVLLLLLSACAPGLIAAPEKPVEVLPAPSADPSPVFAAATARPAAPQTLAAGEFELPAASAFGAPGFHEAFTEIHNLPPNLEQTAGRRLIITLRDAGRPGQTCASEHPLSGCATVDWSDAESRPKVPAGGVFDNSLTVQLASGPHTFFLSETGILANEPDAYDPGWPHTSVGGSARTWETVLPAELVANSQLELHLVMTKFQDPAVRIGYEITLEPAR